jgi:hypothetical protein
MYGDSAVVDGSSVLGDVLGFSNRATHAALPGPRVLALSRASPAVSPPRN